jgi:AcrR family transcriptional regulator
MAVSRDQVLEAAAQTFRKKGYHAASMADIAEAVGLQKATLYHHVSGKQEILFEILDRALDLLNERIGAVASQNIPHDQKFKLAMRAYLVTLTEEIDLAAVLLMEHRSLESKLHARHIPKRDKFEAVWRQLISDGVEAGVFDCADTAMTVRALLGVMNWTITWYRSRGEMSIHEISDYYAALFLDGIRK